MKKTTSGVTATPATPRFSNGDLVRDTVTKLEGIVVATTIWLNGCVRYLVQPPEIKDGKPVENTYFDEQQIELLLPSTPAATADRTGGDRTAPSPAYRRPTR